VKFVSDRGLTDKRSVRVQVMKGLITLTLQDNGEVVVDMGAPVFAPAQVPFDASGLDGRTEGRDTLWPLDVGGATRWISTVSMGNPHAVFFVDDIARYDISTFGREIEHHALFPERANISLAHVEGDTINLVVWERGVGLTLACGTAACAALVAAARRDLCGRSAQVYLPGGALQITWREDNHVLMTGPVATSFSGTVDLDHLMATAS
jgi:diaminopimelate epimerase